MTDGHRLCLYMVHCTHNTQPDDLLRLNYVHAFDTALW